MLNYAPLCRNRRCHAYAEQVQASLIPPLNALPYRGMEVDRRATTRVLSLAPGDEELHPPQMTSRILQRRAEDGLYRWLYL